MLRRTGKDFVTEIFNLRFLVPFLLNNKFRIHPMKICKILFISLLTSGLLVSCSKDQDDIDFIKPGDGNQRNLTVENFVHRGLNEIYLYKAFVPELADNYFASQAAKDDFLDNYATPEDLFYDGLLASQDNF